MVFFALKFGLKIIPLSFVERNKCELSFVTGPVGVFLAKDRTHIIFAAAHFHLLDSFAIKVKN